MGFLRIRNHLVRTASIVWVQLALPFEKGWLWMRNGAKIRIDEKESAYLVALLTAKRAEVCPDCRAQLQSDTITYCPKCQGAERRAG